MRRWLFLLGLIGLLLVGCGAPPTTVPIQSAPPVADNPGHTVYQVIGADAPGWMRVGGPGRYLCDGTQATGGDQVELQAACDASSAAKGVVMPVGTLYLSKPSDAPTQYTATGVTLTYATSTLSTIVWDGTFAITDVAVGDVIRLSGGNNGSAKTLEDNHEELVTTVLTVDAKAGTFTIAHDLPSGSNYTALVMRRLIGALRITSGNVVIQGNDFTKSEIHLATDQNCDLIHVEPVTALSHVLRISGVYLNGSRAQQGDHVAANINIACNGLVVNSLADSTYLEHVAICQCKGDSAWFGTGRVGLQHVWFAHNSGGGLYATKAQVFGRELECYDVNGPAAVFSRVGLVGDQSSVLFSQCQSNGGAYARNAAAQSEYSLKILNCSKLAIDDGLLNGRNANVLGAILIDDATQTTITGNVFYVDDVAGGTARSCLKLTDNAFFDNVITGNVFDTNCTVPIARTNWDCNVNVIKDNTFAHAEIRADYATVINGSGGDIIGRSLVVRSGLNCTTTTTVGSALALGVTYNATVTNGNRIRVQTLGPLAYFPILDNIGGGVAVGDELTTSGTATLATKAASTNTVIAIARGTHAGGGAGARAYVAATLVTPYVKP